MKLLLIICIFKIFKYVDAKKKTPINQFLRNFQQLNSFQQFSYKQIQHPNNYNTDYQQLIQKFNNSQQSFETNIQIDESAISQKKSNSNQINKQFKALNSQNIKPIQQNQKQQDMVKNTSSVNIIAQNKTKLNQTDSDSNFDLLNIATTNYFKKIFRDTFNLTLNTIHLFQSQKNLDLFLKNNTNITNNNYSIILVEEPIEKINQIYDRNQEIHAKQIPDSNQIAIKYISNYRRDVNCEMHKICGDCLLIVGCAWCSFKCLPLSIINSQNCPLMQQNSCFRDSCFRFRDCKSCIDNKKCQWCEQKHEKSCKEIGNQCISPILKNNKDSNSCPKYNPLYKYTIPNPLSEINRSWEGNMLPKIVKKIQNHDEYSIDVKSSNITKYYSKFAP